MQLITNNSITLKYNYQCTCMYTCSCFTCILTDIGAVVCLEGSEVVNELSLGHMERLHQPSLMEQDIRHLERIISERGLLTIPYLHASWGRYAHDFVEKTFTDYSHPVKSLKVVSLENFPLYSSGIIRSCYQVIRGTHAHIGTCTSTTPQGIKSVPIVSRL